MAKLADCTKNIAFSILPRWKTNPRVFPWIAINVHKNTSIDQDKFCEKGLKLMKVLKFVGYSILHISRPQV